MIEGFRFKIDGDRLYFFGLSFGYGDSDPWLIAKTGRFAVIRVPGSREWSQVGDSIYHPASLILLEFESDDVDFRVIRVLKEQEPGRFWRRSQAEFIRDLEREETKNELPPQE